MSFIVKIFRILYTAYAAVIFFALLCITLPFFFLFRLLLGKRALFSFMILCKCIAYGLGICTGIRYRRYGNPRVANDRAYVIIANHRSNMDAPAASVACHGRVRYLAKKELLKVPLLGLLFGITTVIVDRSSKESRRRSMEMMIRYLRAGDHIFIFPEGTRNKTKEPLIPFKDGAFRIAIEAQAPVLPVIFTGTDKVMPNKPLWMRPGRIGIHVLDPVETSGMQESDVPMLKERIYRLMFEAYKVLEKRNLK